MEFNQLNQDGIIIWRKHSCEIIYFSKDTWSDVNKLKEWVQYHYVTPNIIIFKKEDNTYTETDEEKLEVLLTHFENVLNSDVNIDWIILSEIKQKPVFKIIDTTL